MTTITTPVFRLDDLSARLRTVTGPITSTMLTSSRHVLAPPDNAHRPDSSAHVPARPACDSARPSSTRHIDWSHLDRSARQTLSRLHASLQLGRHASTRLTSTGLASVSTQFDTSLRLHPGRVGSQRLHCSRRDSTTSQRRASLRTPHRRGDS